MTSNFNRLQLSVKTICWLFAVVFAILKVKGFLNLDWFYVLLPIIIADGLDLIALILMDITDFIVGTILRYIFPQEYLEDINEGDTDGKKKD